MKMRRTHYVMTMNQHEQREQYKMKTSLNIITVCAQDLKQKEEAVEKHNKYEYANKKINKYT